jgi:NADH-quinone oxidoreductase subunit L
MGGLRKHLPVTFITFLIAVLAISGIFPFAGFFSKDEILANAYAHDKIVWAIALIASLMTSFYMFRLFFLTFSGQARASHDVMHHIHESPKSMTVPLVILAILSVVGGFMGVPEALHGSHWLNGFLSPVFAPSAAVAHHAEHLDHATEYMLMGLVTVLTLVVIAVAYVRYVSKKEVPAAEGVATGTIHRLLYNKYYVDELYNAVIVKPLFWLSVQFDAIVERLGIDNVVNTFGSSVVWGSRAARRLQTGSIGFYIFVMVISIMVLLAAALVRL